MSQKKIYLGQIQGPLERDNVRYRVKKLVNDVRYRVGESLSRKQVDTLCERTDWTVTIIDGSL